MDGEIFRVGRRISWMILLGIWSMMVSGQTITHVMRTAADLEAEMSGRFSDDLSLIKFCLAESQKYLIKEEMDSCRLYAQLALNKTGVQTQFLDGKPNTEYSEWMMAAKVEAWSLLGRSDQYLDPGSAALKLQSAVALASLINNGESMAENHQSLGLAYDGMGSYGLAIEHYQRSHLIYLQLGKELEANVPVFYTGISLRFLGKYGDALEKHIQSLEVFKTFRDTNMIIESLLAMGFIYMYVDKWDDSAKKQQEALALYRLRNDTVGISRIYNDMGVLFDRAGKFDSAAVYHQKALELRLNLDDNISIANSCNYLGDVYMSLENFEKAKEYYKQCIHFAQLGGYPYLVGFSHLGLGTIYRITGEYDLALHNLEQCIRISEGNNFINQIIAYTQLGKLYIDHQQIPQAIKVLEIAKSKVGPSNYRERKWISEQMIRAYAKTNDFKKAYEEQVVYDQIKDSVSATENYGKIANLAHRLELENRQVMQDEARENFLQIREAELKRQKAVRNLSLFALIVAVIFMSLFYIRYIEKKKLNNQLNHYLSHLKATQTQLIHAEKMASLGELTAAVAHEIQNPLNFVKNFSEVNSELTKELRNEIEAGNQEAVLELAQQICDNQDKITHHGQRAESIVKGMLQHSRSSSGIKEPTDINALCEEYLRLSYYGMRTKDNNFQAKYVLNLDPQTGLIQAIPQDLGRVLLNMMNNAFYAVNEKNLPLKENFIPVVTVSTQRYKDRVEISIADNGSGMADQVKAKIFQPFFTTKPTGEGTGLGLSISYDIIKSLGGEIRVKSTVDRGSVFTIILPV